MFATCSIIKSTQYSIFLLKGLPLKGNQLRSNVQWNNEMKHDILFYKACFYKTTEKICEPQPYQHHTEVKVNVQNGSAPKLIC